jgi:hypothetical protein
MRPETFAATLCALLGAIGPSDYEGVEDRAQGALDALNKSVRTAHINPTKPASFTVRLVDGAELEVTVRRVGDQ